MDRRTMIGRGALAAGGFAIGAGFTAPQCSSPKNLSVYVQTVVGALEEIAPLLPGSAQLIAKAAKVAKEFDKAYREGKFTDAVALFENLAGFISQIAGDLGVNNPTVKVALAVAGIATRAIAVLLKSQETEPAVARARSTATSAQRRQVSLVNRLAAPSAVEAAFQVSKL